MSKLSLKYKIMLLLTLVPLLLLGSYLFLVIRVFENDKIAYIYDTNSNVNRSLASQARGVFQTMLSSVKPIIQERILIGEFGVLSQELFHGETNLLFIARIDNKNGTPRVGDHLKKNKTLKDDLASQLPLLYQEIIELKDGEFLVRTPFPNNNILMIQHLFNPESKQQEYYALVFQNQELSEIFSKRDKQLLYLSTEDGTLLFQNDPQVESTKATALLGKSFFTNLKKKKSAEGTESVKIKDQTYLVSYNKIGFGGLLVASMVNRNKALSAIKILLTKSLLFAGILLSVTLMISIIGSQTVTQALFDLIKATRRIAVGDFNFRLRIKSKDEIGTLAKSFNLMSEEINRLLMETAEKARMEGELQTARTVQETLFPPASSKFGATKIAGHYEPASECGGDWWYYSKMDRKILLCIGDATGHGAPAALITSAARSAASILESLPLEPAQLMQFLNKAIYNVSKGKVMMTFFLGLLDTETGVFTYCNASHEVPYLLKGETKKPRKKDLLPLMDVNNARLGQDPTTQYDQTTVELEPNDFILFYTDGIPDIRNEKGESLGEREFLKLILQIMEKRGNPEAFVAQLNGHLNTYRGNSGLIDDVTYFCITYGGAA